MAIAEPTKKPENLGCSSPAFPGRCALSFTVLRGFLMLTSSLKTKNQRTLLGLMRLFFKEEERVLWLPFR